ncbi:MAG: MFS transporter, partial [Actinobacteria bacterium]
MTATLLSLNRRTFASLRRHRNYRLFFAGQLVSLPGTWMQRIAQAWLVLSLTHSPFAVGVL